MKIDVLSHSLFDDTMYENGITDDNVERYTDTAFICILHTHNLIRHYKLEDCYFKCDHSNVLRVYFDDIFEDKETSNRGKVTAYGINDQQAKDIYHFVKDRIHNGVKRFIIHCEAGISRSGGVAAFIADYTGIKFSELKKCNPQILPNERVYRMLTNNWLDDKK